MNRIKRAATVAIATGILFGATVDLNAQSNDPDKQFIGTWKLVTTVQRKADGSSGPNPMYGPKGIGYIIYTAEKIMCATLMNPEQPKWRSSTAPTAEELKTAKNSFHAYCGPYEVSAKDSTVIHHVELDNIPNDLGSVRKRRFRFTGNQLFLTADPPPAGTTEYTLTWERMK